MNFLQKKHLKEHHEDRVLYEGLDECFNRYITIKGEEIIGVKCDYDTFLEWASIYGVRQEKFIRNLLSRGAILPKESDEAIIEDKSGKKVIVDIAWVRAREYMLTLERQIIRSR